MMRNFILGMIVTLLLLIAGAWLVVREGYLDFSADRAPSALENSLAMSAVDASTDRHAPRGNNPVAPTEENIVAGAKLYVDHCAGCHGVPSNPDSQFGRSFNPPVPAFFHDAPDMSESQNFYIIEHGIRWSGMPAWSHTLTDQQVWEAVTFLANLDKLPPAAQAALGPSPPAGPMPKGMHMSH